MEDLADYWNTGRNQKRLLSMLYNLGCVRYATFKQLKKCNKPSVSTHIVTKKSLQLLSDLKYLSSNNGAFFISSKSQELLGKTHYPVKGFMKRYRADPAEHTINITDHLATVINGKNFFTVIYPSFPVPGEKHLIPDACVIWRTVDTYKIQFIEVEATDKPAGYLEYKEHRYKLLAKSYDTYEWWLRKCKELRLPECSVDEFKFTYRIVKNEK